VSAGGQRGDGGNQALQILRLGQAMIAVYEKT